RHRHPAEEQGRDVDTPSRLGASVSQLDGPGGHPGEIHKGAAGVGHAPEHNRGPAATTLRPDGSALSDGVDGCPVRGAAHYGTRVGQRSRVQAGLRSVWVACVAGTLHAAFSLSWALGSPWLLSTVG